MSISENKRRRDAALDGDRSVESGALYSHGFDGTETGALKQFATLNRTCSAMLCRTRSSERQNA
ncbi:hypothetical protein GCM10007857_81250 [Bradyrhizobium iriomotense]|uniref:Uncharacterized protein n=1 Tax=Bradyrhizobium iriomotense TaxID=441950 RepID=A0ABQ6BBE9_9BRAD|nr:hypothetical protein GCM10007857_81250 [Bradyrhizobium iriomotense]